MPRRGLRPRAFRAPLPFLMLALLFPKMGTTDRNNSYWGPTDVPQKVQQGRVEARSQNLARSPFRPITEGVVGLLMQPLERCTSSSHTNQIRCYLGVTTWYMKWVGARRFPRHPPSVRPTKVLSTWPPGTLRNIFNSVVTCENPHPGNPSYA